MLRRMMLVICLLLVISSYCGVLCQSIAVRKCLEYKQEVYETIETFGFFLYDAPEMKDVRDTCVSAVPVVPFIVGGKKAGDQEFPHMARLGHATDDNISWFCGGTLISELYVLTAAHCFFASVGEVNRVRLGEVDRGSSLRRQDFVVRRYISHPDYDGATELLFNDIGLIELIKRVSFTKFIHPACLPDSSGDEFKSLIAIGWGSQTIFGGNSDQLLKVELEPFSYERCQMKVNQSITEQKTTGLNRRTQMCAGSSMSKDTCKGDSGGPLLALHREFPCMYYVTGITSAGIGGCGAPNVPAIYTRVHAFVPWVSNIVWSNNLGN